jgi:decaprenyl-phosphate phosphoribosyltransferase
MRPPQWVKNSFVLAPLVFARKLTSPEHVGRALLAAVLFCAASGAVYLINDLADRERDRAHPSKRTRPIASGRLSARTAKAWSAGLLVGSLAVGMLLDWRFAAVLSAYFALNVAYSASLKHVAFIDVSVIALGFLCRVWAGALAIRVPISVWLVVCTFLLSLYLGLGKRKHELVAVANGGATRRVLDSYQLNHLKGAMLLSALATAAGYAAYTFDPATAAEFGTRWLPVTIPFIAVGLLRFYRLTERVGHPESPTEQMVRDRPFILNVLAWGAVVVALIYA